MEQQLGNPAADIAAALAKAQGAFPPIPRDRTVTVKMASGGSYQFAYAPLDTILHAVRPALAANGLALTQLLGDGKLVTRLLHAGGGSLDSVLPLSSMADPQKFGSLLTYLRRYAITALLGVAAEEDDDGNHAVGNHAEPAKKLVAAATAPAKKPAAHQAASGLSVQTKRFHAVRNECGIDEEFGKQILAEFGLSSSMDVTADNVEKIVLRMKQFAGMEPPPVGALPTKPERVAALGAIVQAAVAAARPAGAGDVVAAIGSVVEKPTKGGASWLIVTEQGEFRTFSPAVAEQARNFVGHVATLRIVDNKGFKNVSAVDKYVPAATDVVDAGMPSSMTEVDTSDIPF